MRAPVHYAQEMEDEIQKKVTQERFMALTKAMLRVPLTEAEKGHLAELDKIHKTNEDDNR